MGQDGSARAPQSTAEARRAINETRGRIARDLDAVEHGLVAKKRALTEKLKLNRARGGIRQHPWWATAGALGVGLLLGLARSAAHKSKKEKKREKRQAWRRHRREHRKRQRAALDSKTAEPRDTSGRKGLAASTMGTLAGAVAAGLADRAKRKGREILSK